jgi:G3E family GTPase
MASDAPLGTPKTPISVLTGFLGSGKTTFLKAVLAAPEMAHTAVIINEAGDASLDHLLVKEVAEQTFQLPSGCLCCVRRLDIVSTVATLIEQRDAGKIPAFARIVIETSGLADPAPILYTLAQDPMLSHVLDFRAVATVVDSVLGEATIARHAAATAQVAIADRLLLSKTDLSAPSPSLLQILDALNARAPRAHLPAEDDLGALLFDVPMNISAPATAPPLLTDDFGIETTSLVLQTPPGRMEFARALGRLASERGEDLLRMKGLVAFADRPDAVAVMHAVQHTLYRPQWLPDWPDADQRSRLVFILRDIPRAEIFERFAFVRPILWTPLQTFVCEPVRAAPRLPEGVV